MSENCFLRKSVSLGTFAQSYLTETEKQDNVPPDSTFGGILSDNKYAWYVNGSRFQVVDVRRGKTIAGWCFGSVVKDSTTKVVCVAEIPILSRETPVLVVGLEYLSTGGTICVFDVLTSKVIRALHLKEKISSLHVIDGGKDLLPLQGPLRSFDGVIGVGCVGGGILLIDLCRHSIEEEQDRDEVDTCRIEELTCKDLPQLEYHKQKLRNGVHLAINLNSSINFINNHKRGPDIAITSLCYCPQLASLIVGYSFGAWQLWELLTMKCVYTSPTYDKHIPVSHFAIQEPSDDPKPVCYIWAIYSYCKEILTTYPLAVLYSLNYQIKEFHDGYGVLYQDFETCMVRYQMELGINSSSRTSPETNILRLTTYKSNVSKLPSLDNPEDSLSICYMAWNMFGTDGVQSYIGLFDLNQWYKAQMPAYTDSDSANYLSVVCVTDLIGNSDFLLDITIDEGTVKQFLGVQKPEEHYYTSALSYEITCCEEKVTHFICHRGQQRTLLKSIEESDSLIFLKPQEICKTAQKFGLSPIFFDSSYSAINAPGKFLLSLALEHQMIGWLCKCAKIWSNGRFKSSGYPLEYFLDWAWNRAGDLKANADSLTVPLFDYSETIIDANNQRIMNVCINQLKNLVTIYDFILNQLEEFILHKDIIHQQYSSLQMAVTHFEVIQWMVNSGLLPESEETFLYPIETFISYYKTRRLEIQNAHYEQFSSKESLLFIDILLKTEFSDMQLQECWKEDEGDGCYPPPSMQSLLRTYLIDNVNFSLKHTILIYAFLDLSMALDRDNSRNTFIITQLIKFPTIFRVNPSVTALSQAFWHLDHKDFTSALDLLLDPAISNSDIKLWHHRTIISALLIQKQYNLALTYYQIRKPPLKEVDDIVKLISLFIKNDMIHEAIEFQREHVNRKDQETILTHLYRECNSVKQLKKILQYALTETEERVIMKYLKDVSHPQQEELEVMYYVKRFRYNDIMKTTNREGQSAVPSGLQGQKMISYKESFAKRLAGFFPKISTDLYKVCQNQKEVFQNKVISRPQPLSVVIHCTDQQVKYKSNMIQMSMVKARETWKKPIDDETHGSENCPFVRTPLSLTSSTKKRSIICPKIIKIDENVDEENMEPSCKKQKLQPRQSISSVSLSLKNSFNDSNLPSVPATKLSTPLIKRKVKRLSGQSLEGSENFAICTPQSILKVRDLIHSSTVQESQSPSSSKVIASTSSLGLTPRKPTSRLTVHFESSANDSRSIQQLEQISDFMNISAIPKEDRFSKSYENKVDEKTDNESKETKDPSSDDVFYSPESSLEDNLQAPEEKTTNLELSPIKNQIKGRNSYKDKTPEKIDDTISKETTQKPIPHKQVINSSENSPKELKKAAKEESVLNISTSPVVKTPRSVKPKSRKSLSRMVLENNALSTLSPTVKRSVRCSLNSPKSKTSLSSILGEGDSSGPSNQSVEKDKLEETSITELTVTKNSSSENIYTLRGRVQKRRSVSSSKRSSLQSISSSFDNKEIISLNSTEQSMTQDQQIVVQEDVSMEQENEDKSEQIEMADVSSTPDSIIEWIEKVKATTTVSSCSSLDNTEYNSPSLDTVDKSVVTQQQDDSKCIDQENSNKIEIEESITSQKLEEQDNNDETEKNIDPSMSVSENKDESVYEWLENVRVTMVPSRFSFCDSTKQDEIFSCDTTVEKSLLQEQKELSPETTKLNEIEEDKIDVVETQKIEDVQIAEPIQEEISVADETVDVNIEQDVQMEVEIEEEITQNVQEIIELSDPTIIDKSASELPTNIASTSHQVEIDPELTSVSNKKDQTINTGFIESVPVETLTVEEQLSEIDHTKHSPNVIIDQNLTLATNDSDKTVNKAFIASTNVIEISDSSTDESLTEPSSTEDNDDLNNAMIGSNETTQKPVYSNPPSNKSTIGSSSEDSFESNTSFKWDYESSRDEGQEETVENVQQVETEVEEVDKKMVDQGIQVTIIQEDIDVVEEDGIIHDWAMEEEVQSEQEPFLTILVTKENELKLELTHNTNDEVDDNCKVDEIKEESAGDAQVENEIESAEVSNEEVEIKQDLIQIQDDVEKSIQDKQQQETAEEINPTVEPEQIEEDRQEEADKINKKSSTDSKIENIEDTLTSEKESNTDNPLKKSQDSIDISKKNPRIILHDVTKSWTPEMRELRGVSIDREIPKEEEELEQPKTPSRRLSRSASVDPDTPVRKSRRLAGLGLPQKDTDSDVAQQSVSARTRRSSISKIGHSNENVDKKETSTKKLKKGPEKELKKESKEEEEDVLKAPQRRNKRSKSDCDIEVEVKMPVKRNTRSNSMSSTSVLPTVPENIAIPSTSLRRSSRSRSKTPDKTVLETSIKSLRKGALAQIPEEPETAPAQVQKGKRGRPRKTSTK